METFNMNWTVGVDLYESHDDGTVYINDVPVWRGHVSRYSILTGEYDEQERAELAMMNMLHDLARAIEKA
jgi:hypothetical protein